MLDEFKIYILLVIILLLRIFGHTFMGSWSGFILRMSFGIC